MTDTTTSPGPPTATATVDEVAADTDDLEVLLERSRAVAAAVDELANRVANARSMVANAIGVSGPAPTVFRELRAAAEQIASHVASVTDALAGGVRPLDSAADGDPLVDLGLLPDRANGPLTYPLYLGSQASLSASASSTWMVRVRTQTFHPRDAAGRYAGRAAHPRMARLALAGDERNWNPRPGQAAAASRWRSVGRHAGRVGTAAVLVGSGWAEWQALAGDPSMSTADRVGQTTAAAAATTAGSWAGVWLGSQAGVAVGTAICPGVGTVVGALVGGFVGGVVGGQLGHVVGQGIKGVAGELADGAAGRIGDLRGFGRSAIDVATFWG